MFCQAFLYFKSGNSHDGTAPSSVDPDGKFTFGRNFPRMVDTLDDSARELGVTEPSQFVWGNPLYDEGGLDKLSDEEFQELERKCNATAKWIPIGQGIETFEALGSRHSLTLEHGSPTVPKRGSSMEQDFYLAFEVACFHATLAEAAKRGEQAFQVQFV